MFELSIHNLHICKSKKSYLHLFAYRHICLSHLSISPRAGMGPHVREGVKEYVILTPNHASLSF